MAAFSQLPSGKWRAPIRIGGTYKGATFDRKRDAEAWARGIEGQAKLVKVNGCAPPPAGATVADLIDRHLERHTCEPGR